MADRAEVNYLFINARHDVWVARGEAGGEVEPTVTRIEGVPEEIIAVLRGADWDLGALSDVQRAAVRALPSVDL